jgi:hypothetical protein
MNFVEKAVSFGGKLVPLVIPVGSETVSCMNPSVFVDSDGDILVNIRSCNYILYHAENNQKFPTVWGPLAYLHPEKDQRLVTENYLCRLNDKLEIKDFAKVEMQNLHEPIWEFVGLEDARIVEWDSKYWLVGVRRDTTVNGQGRMEYTELDLDKKNWRAQEIYRHRIPTPAPDTSYCEKNWIPIPDKPFHFIKWSSPTEVVYADPYGDTTQIALVPHGKQMPDQRGSSQAFRFGDYYVAITHEVNLFFNYLNQKDAIYRHRFLVWDTDWNLVGASEPFSFLDARVEFCVGATFYKDELLVSFSIQDNVAFILTVTKDLLEKEIQSCLFKL